jgi:hypothetical protein
MSIETKYPKYVVKCVAHGYFFFNYPTHTSTLRLFQLMADEAALTTIPVHNELGGSTCFSSMYYSYDISITTHHIYNQSPHIQCYKWLPAAHRHTSYLRKFTTSSARETENTTF